MLPLLLVLLLLSLLDWNHNIGLSLDLDGHAMVNRIDVLG